nr:MAG TPA: hypothetical protein [Caudoviricetes sp.]
MVSAVVFFSVRVLVFNMVCTSILFSVVCVFLCCDYSIYH